MFRVSKFVVHHARCQASKLPSTVAAAASRSVASLAPTSSHITKFCLATGSNRFASSTAGGHDEKYPAFADVADLHPLSKEALSEKGIKTMTEIQFKTWKHVMDGADVLGRARTGTGKTLGFLLPAVEKVLKNRVDGEIGLLILSPTRELALQIQDVAEMLCLSHGSLRSQSIFGGTSRNDDIRKMESRVPDILVATPGRMLDHLNNSNVRGQPFERLLSNIKVVVLDETDRLLDMGFRDDIDSILGYLPRSGNRQTLLFSATIPAGVKRILQAHLRQDFVTVDCIRDEDPSTHTNALVDQSYVILKPDRMVSGIMEVLLGLMEEPKHKVMVFFPTNNMVILFSNLLNCMGKRVLDIHAKRTQSARTNVSNRFRQMESGVLLTSDVSSRGVDYPDVTHVIQVGMTPDRETYIHRLGRTARAGKKGKGILILTEPEIGFLRDLHGLSLHSNQQLQSLTDGPPTEMLQKTFGPVVADVRQGRLPMIEEAASEAYMSMIGLLSQRLKSLRTFSPATVVRMINSLVEGVGLAKPPSISPRMAEQAGLMYEPGLNLSGGRGARSNDRYNNDGGYGGGSRGGYSRGGYSRQNDSRQGRYGGGGGGRDRGFGGFDTNSGYGSFGSRDQSAFGSKSNTGFGGGGSSGSRSMFDFDSDSSVGGKQSLFGSSDFASFSDMKLKGPDGDFGKGNQSTFGSFGSAGFNFGKTDDFGDLPSSRLGGASSMGSDSSKSTMDSLDSDDDDWKPRGSGSSGSN